MTEERIPVLIAGGSLVGLATAVFLGMHGIPAVLVERNTGLSPHPRARGLNARSMELFRWAGVEDMIRSTPSAVALADNSGIIAAESLAGKELGVLREGYHRDVKAGDGAGAAEWQSPTGWCLCHQHEVEAVLRARAAELGTVLRFGTTLVGLEQDLHGVTAVVRQADGAERGLRADYLVAADGAGSGIRDLLKIAVDGPGTLGHFLNLRFRADLVEALRGRRFVMCYVISGATRSALLPVDNAREWLLHVPFDPAESSEFSAQECVELVRGAAGIEDLDVVVEGVAAWESAGRTAASFARGRVFLAGDAAHTMPPTGAFGSNTGIQDARDLAWKLAAVLRGEADAGLLDTYDTERRPVAERTVEQAVLRSRDRPRLAGGPSPAPDPRIQPDPVVIHGQVYRSAAVAPPPDDGGGSWELTPSGRPGTKAPHVWLRKDGRTISAVDLYGDGFVLLAGPEGQKWPQAAQRSGARIRAYVVGRDVHPCDADPCAVYGIGPAGAAVIRPDGFVAWRDGGAADAACDLDALLRSLRCLPTA